VLVFAGKRLSAITSANAVAGHGRHAGAEGADSTERPMETQAAGGGR